MPKKKRMAFTAKKRKGPSIHAQGSPDQQRYSGYARAARLEQDSTQDVVANPDEPSRKKRKAPAAQSQEPAFQKRLRQHSGAAPAEQHASGSKVASSIADAEDEAVTGTQSDSRSTVSSKADEEGELAITTTLTTTTLPYLVPQTIYIPGTTIQQKWRPLPSPTQDRIKLLLQSVGQPVVGELGPDADKSEGKGAEAQEAVGKVLRALEKRLPRMPFPPKTREEAFEYETLLRDNARAEAQLQVVEEAAMELDGQLNRQREGMDKGQEEVEGLEQLLEEDKEAIEGRLVGKYGKLLQIPSEEPPDSAIRIKLAPRKRAQYRVEGIELEAEARRLLSELQAHLAKMHESEIPGKEVQKDLDGAVQIAEELLGKYETRTITANLATG